MAETVTNVAVLVGSLRKGSYTRQIANVLIGLAPPSLRAAIVEIRDLPLYDADAEASPPKPWVAFRESVAKCGAVLFVTPEYNRSVPGALKNAIDVGSRPYGKSVWEHKPAAIVSVSPGALGAFGANHHLRQSLVFLNMPVLQMPEAYVGGVATLLDESGALKTDGTREFLTTFMRAFADWVERTRVA